ncbi:metal ABC transporter solute-binding protein, Zn/Mn family [Sediminitomix flava]|uniref:Manganese/zinc/iron transport system substrate-binding protein n=1 Tax=Sediminitomix flava TaxID=379075 RepID=A0A315Z7P1_SEDFL|nr:zinc ABC transporter substrate-binding protein [Sediminitomix flava]PWJ40061.1 manganese/zinc/iron transport system substrate-binding protein [Sediminitomix flava]
MDIYKTKALTGLLTISLLFSLLSCSSENSKEETSTKIKIVTTTGMIKDAVVNIVGDHAEVVGLMGSGVDPHLYKASPKDLKHIREADLIFYNGLHLEGNMTDVLEKVAKKKHVVSLGEQIPTSKLIALNENGVYDPHIWFDVALWREGVASTIKELVKADSVNAKAYEQNGKAYLKELDVLNGWVKEHLKVIPESQRVLITAHDAFSYFGKAYDIEVKGLQGISTMSEYGLRDVKNLVDFIVENKIKSVFIESSVPIASIEAVVEGCKEKGHEVKIGGTLYSDAMGAEGTTEGTYLGMVRYNVETMVVGLK